MIIIRLMGGLGNQMFQYAFGLYTAINNNTCLKVDTSLLEKPKTLQADTIYRDFELEMVFDLNIKKATKFEVELYNGIPDKLICRKAVFKILRNVLNKKVYIQKNHDFDLGQLKIKNNTCLVGRWQSEKYFKPIEDEIRKHFCFKNPISDNYTKYSEAINTLSNATCLHIRRTDYVSHPIYSKMIGALPDKYYLKAIQQINQLIEPPTLFVFSDDLESTKQMLNSFQIPNKLIFIDVDRPNPHDELQLMTLCKHHIISNSTFSWWGAWLSNNTNKIVLAPDKWSLDPIASSQYIIPENYIKIPCSN